jgi:hypothetical protein
MKTRFAIIATAVTCMGLIAFAFSPADKPDGDDKAQIERIIKAGTAAFNAGEYAKSVENIHPTRYTKYGSSPQGELAKVPRKSAVEVLIALAPMLKKMQVSKPIDLDVQVHGEAAVATYLRKVDTGDKKWSTIRMTGVFIKTGGAWQLVHEHESLLM